MDREAYLGISETWRKHILSQTDGALNPAAPCAKLA